MYTNETTEAPLADERSFIREGCEEARLLSEGRGMARKEGKRTGHFQPCGQNSLSILASRNLILLVKTLS
jgi:hypothetical protein